MKYFFVTLLIVTAFAVNTNKAIAQKNNWANKIDSLSLDTLNDISIRLENLGQTMITVSDENARLIAAYNFVKTLLVAFRIHNSYFYPFDSIKNISVLVSPDNNFRIFTWNIALNTESYQNFGVIQLNPDYMKKIKDTTNLRSFYPLIDKSEIYKRAMDTTANNLHWFGALYYKIILNKHKNKTYYTLLGWDGNTKMSNKKIVESLYFENNIPFFGAPIFDMKNTQYPKPLKRLIFEYNNYANMALRYEPSKEILVQENVAPTRQQDYGKPETYVPDGSYDYYKFNKKNGKWEKQIGMLKDFNMQK
ncbi:MAG: hypothetical protein H3C45_10865 [Bacteroidia bacterium]|nr:hypothetical protein [Bacteroidia bacterium]